MASTNLTKDEFVDFIVAFLLDKMIRGEEILPNNESFNELMKTMKSRGVDKLLLNHYISSDPLVRNKYKSVRKVFTPGSKDSLTVSLQGDVRKEKDTKRTLKDLVKKALKIVVAHKRRSGFPLSEEKVEKIIEKVMIEEGFILDDKE